MNKQPKQKQEQKMSNQGKKVKGVVDIVFLMDVTGSMQPCIDGLKDSLEKFFETLTGPQSVVRDWRGKVVGFRDYEEDGASDWLEDNDFTSDIGELKRQLRSMTARGGGDIPESLLDAIWTVAAGPQVEDEGRVARPDEWRYRRAARRAIVAFTDAPFKDPMSAPGCCGGDGEDVARVLTDRRVIFKLIAPDGVDGAECFKWADSFNNGEYVSVPGGGFALQEFMSNKATISKLLAQLGKTISQTMEAEAL